MHSQTAPHRRSCPELAPSGRRGAAAVEFAVCAPIMFLITFGAIEAANEVYLKQILTQAAYEGARVATATGGTDAKARARCNDILTARKIKSATIAIDPPIAAGTPAGTRINITVSAPAAGNSFAVLKYFRNTSLSGSVVMSRN